MHGLVWKNGFSGCKLEEPTEENRLVLTGICGKDSVVAWTVLDRVDDVSPGS